MEAEIFDVSQMKQLIRDPHSTESSSFKIVHNFLGNCKSENLKQIVKDMLNKFPANFGRLTDEQGKRFVHDIVIMEQVVEQMEHTYNV